MYHIKIIDNLNDSLPFFLFDLYIPIVPPAIQAMLSSYHSSLMILVLDQQNNTVGHCCCFLNSKKNQLEFGFFGQFDHTNSSISNLLLENIESIASDWHAHKIIGPVNAPPGVYLYGFDTHDEKQKSYLQFFKNNLYSDYDSYRIYEIPILPKRNLKKPHNLIHIESMNGIDRNHLKRELHKASLKVIGPVADDLILPTELWDTVFYLIDHYGYPECIQLTYDNNNEVNGTAVIIPNSNPQFLLNNGRSIELRIASGGWDQSHAGKGYAMYHMYKFGNMCKKNKVKRLLIGQINTKNARAIRAMEKFGCPLAYEHLMVQKTL